MPRSALARISAVLKRVAASKVPWMSHYSCTPAILRCA